jgi:hypothetical protein
MKVPQRSDMPSFQDFIDHSAVIDAGGAQLFLPTGKKARNGSKSLLPREAELMTRTFGAVYAGEIPAHLFQSAKPKIKDVLSSAEVGARFALSPAACKGVLNRDKTRGRSMPERLKAALEAVAGIAEGMRE